MRKSPEGHLVEIRWTPPLGAIALNPSSLLGPITMIYKLLKRLLTPYLDRKFRSQPTMSCLCPDNLYAYFDLVYKTRLFDGAIIEVGCATGATAAMAYTLLARQGVAKRYVCIDTFSGFVRDHTNFDFKLGLSEDLAGMFSDNSFERVRARLDNWGLPKIELVKADVSQLQASSLPFEISCALVDVDLSVPIYDALCLIYPKLQEGGVIVVDDCTAGTGFVGALHGYRRFMQDHSLEQKFYMGFGVVTKGDVDFLQWDLKDQPLRETKYLYSRSNPIV